MEVRRASRWYSFQRWGSARPICFPPDMKSSVTRRRSHRSRMSQAPLKRLVEAVYQHENGGIGDRFIPLIELGIERTLAPDDGDAGAEDGGHPQQGGQAPAEADAAEHRENHQDEHPHAKPD